MRTSHFPFTFLPVLIATFALGSCASAPPADLR